jgi:hypothetical protein
LFEGNCGIKVAELLSDIMKDIVSSNTMMQGGAEK